MSRNLYPQFYSDFRCIAARCPDSCCKDWDVVVDDESAEFYRSVTGEFGERLKRKMTVDKDGDRIFISENGSCPFWNENKLCDIYINLGEEQLCATCKAFPRLTQDYTAFAEHMLSFACPEAARLMLSKSDCFDGCFEDFTVSGDRLGYDADLMNFLLVSRRLSAEIFGIQNLTFAQRLIKCLEFNSLVQDMLDSENYDIARLKAYDFNADTRSQSGKGNKAEWDFIFRLHERLDIMNKDWLDKLGKSANYRLAPSPKTDAEFKNLALYYIFRYYLCATDSLNVICAIKRIACAYVVISAMIESCKAENDFEKRVMLMQQYSKEVEHSYENSELLEEEFMLNPDFSVENIISVLDSI